MGSSFLNQALKDKEVKQTNSNNKNKTKQKDKTKHPKKLAVDGCSSEPVEEICWVWGGHI